MGMIVSLQGISLTEGSQVISFSQSYSTCTRLPDMKKEVTLLCPHFDRPQKGNPWLILSYPQCPGIALPWPLSPMQIVSLSP